MVKCYSKLILSLLFMFSLLIEARENNSLLASAKLRQYCTACHGLGNLRFIYSDNDAELWNYIFNQNSPNSKKLWAESIREVLNWGSDIPPGFNQMMIPPDRDWMPKGSKRIEFSEEKVDGIPVRQIILGAIDEELYHSTVPSVLSSHFQCKDLGGNKFRPYYLQAINNSTEYKDYSQYPKGLLGQNPMTSSEECNQALKSANHQYGVICSRTGLDGWKPTLYTGTLPGRPDFGYLGGSSIKLFSDCLKATQNSSEYGVCFFGGSDWYISPIDKEGIKAGPYKSIEECMQHTKPNLYF